MGRTLETALEALRERADDMIQLTRRWVEVNSYTENVDGVNAVADLLVEAFAPLRMTLDRRKGERFGDQLLWRTGAEGAPVLLIGHHDTVFPPGHFEGWREENGRAIGPGALDMKGGIAVMHAALGAMHDVGALASFPVVVASVSDEEVGSPESRAPLIDLARGASCALVFESGRLNDAVVTRRRGTGAISVIADGRAAHAGNAHRDGANAIWALSRFVDAAQRLTRYERGVTVNVGMIKGGTSKNTVPARAECAVDLRFETVDDANELVAALRQAAEAAAGEVPGVKMRIEGGVSRLPLERTEASEALYREYAACAEASGLAAPESPIVGGGSDANTVAPLGVPAIDGLGPRGAGFHTTAEYVELSSFLPKAEALLRFLWARR